jgi:hypothetical protein
LSKSLFFGAMLCIIHTSATSVRAAVLGRVKARFASALTRAFRATADW